MASAAPPLASVAALPQASRWPANQPSTWHLLLQYRTRLHLWHLLRHMAPHTSQGPKAVGIPVSIDLFLVAPEFRDPRCSTSLNFEVAEAFTKREGRGQLAQLASLLARHVQATIIKDLLALPGDEKA